MNTNKPLILLDLEQTVIPSWNDRWIDPHAITKINATIASMGIKDFSLGLMSWAVWHAEDLQVFREELQKPLEDALGAPFELVWGMPEWAEEVFLTTRRKVSIHDLFDMMGKHEVLMACRGSPKLQRTVLFFDDTAHHGLRLSDANTGLDIQFINIDRI